jgi:hypothetical protein
MGHASDPPLVRVAHVVILLLQQVVDADVLVGSVRVLHRVVDVLVFVVVEVRLAVLGQPPLEDVAQYLRLDVEVEEIHVLLHTQREDLFLTGVEFGQLALGGGGDVTHKLQTL